MVDRRLSRFRLLLLREVQCFDARTRRRRMGGRVGGIRVQ